VHRLIDFQASRDAKITKNAGHLAAQLDCVRLNSVGGQPGITHGKTMPIDSTKAGSVYLRETLNRRARSLALLRPLFEMEVKKGRYPDLTLESLDLFRSRFGGPGRDYHRNGWLSARSNL
jgi:hypothetical protein